jgi:hypothetical protein
MYVAAGWSSPIPVPARHKFPPPDGVTGRNGQVPNRPSILRTNVRVKHCTRLTQRPMR